jgi:hypothetical protein
MKELALKAANLLAWQTGHGNQTASSNLSALRRNSTRSRSAWTGAPAESCGLISTIRRSGCDFDTKSCRSTAPAVSAAALLALTVSKSTSITSGRAPSSRISRLRKAICRFSASAAISARVLATLLIGVSAAQAELPADPPQSAIFVTSCYQIVTAVIIMPDGKTLLFDNHSKESAEDVKEFAGRSKTPARVYEVGCYREKPLII